MTTEEDYIELLRSVGAYRTGAHIRMASRRHTDRYFDSDALFMYPKQADIICSALAQLFGGYGGDCIEAVIGVPDGATYMAGRVAEHMFVNCNGDRDIFFIRLTKAADYGEQREFAINPVNQAALNGRRVLLLEDTVSSGSSVRSAIRCIESHGGTVAAVGAIWNREGLTAEDLEVEVFHSLINQLLPASLPGREHCPACRQGVPLDLSVGHGVRAEDPRQPSLELLPMAATG